VSKKYLALELFLFVLSLSLYGQTKPVLFSVVAHATPETICQGQFSQLSATVTGGVIPLTYLWYPSATLSDPTSSSPVATPFVSTMYHLVVQDQWLNNCTDSILVIVGSVPPPPSAITGPPDVCSDTSCTYSVDPYPEASSYSWMVPPGALIQYGQNTPSIRLLWGNTSGTVSVIIGTDCGTSVPSVLQVGVTSAPPAPLGIEGPEHLCQADTGNYYTETIPGAVHYNWTVPDDAMIIRGAGTSSVNIKWGLSQGDISVSAENSCGNGPLFSRTVALDSLPASAGTITGADTVCIGKGSYSYSITSLGFANSYGWTLPQGAVITSGQHTNRISVEFGLNAMPGPVTAFGINTCGNGQAAIKNLITKNCLGLDKNFDPGITISPNPVSERLTIHTRDYGEKYEVVVLNLLGEIFYHSRFDCLGADCSCEINTTAFPHGMLYLKLYNASGSSTVKFIVH